jgi:3',5'-cyclic AMP phosphodiesterase CpdA
MPISLPSPTRRKFLTGLGSAIVSFPFAKLDAAEVDQDLIAILNDPHIGAPLPAEAPAAELLRTTTDAEHFKAAADWLLTLPKRPAVVLVNGDLALAKGQPADYRAFAQLIQPLRDAGMPIHLTMGNHDERGAFYEVLTTEKPTQPVVAAKHVTEVQTQRANFFLLDSLFKTGKVEGELGQEQLGWLAKALDARPDKPAVIVAHHNPRLGGDPNHYRGGLVDSGPLWEVLAPRHHVKAYVHGHVHYRELAKHEDIHIVNTPATSYVFDKKTGATGWTMARLRPDGMTITTHTHVADHPWNKLEDALAWRA